MVFDSPTWADRRPSWEETQADAVAAVELVETRLRHQSERGKGANWPAESGRRSSLRRYRSHTRVKPPTCVLRSLDRASGLRIRTEPPVAACRQRLEDAVDRQLATRSAWEVIRRPTFFGEIIDESVRIEPAGPFQGRTSVNGFGLWQPVFRGRLISESRGSKLVGELGWHRTFKAAWVVAILWAGSLFGWNWSLTSRQKRLGRRTHASVRSGPGGRTNSGSMVHASTRLARATGARRVPHEAA